MSLYQNRRAGVRRGAGGLYSSRQAANAGLRHGGEGGGLKSGRDHRFENHREQMRDLTGGNSAAANDAVGGTFEKSVKGDSFGDAFVDFVEGVAAALGIQTPNADRQALNEVMEKAYVGQVIGEVQSQIGDGRAVELTVCKSANSQPNISIHDVGQAGLTSPETCETWLVKPNPYSACSTNTTQTFNITNRYGEKMPVPFNNGYGQPSPPASAQPVQLPGKTPQPSGDKVGKDWSAGRTSEGTRVDNPRTPKEQVDRSSGSKDIGGGREVVVA
jgi:hypothetical protein